MKVFQVVDGSGQVLTTMSRLSEAEAEEYLKREGYPKGWRMVEAGQAWREDPIRRTEV